jgi:hypothetical protein
VFTVSLVVALRGIRDYAPLTEGWWHVYVRWINDGRVPYRDFELLVPPGYPYILRIVTSLVGEGFLALRFVGAIQVALIGVCVYILARHLAGSATSGIVGIFTAGYLASGTAFISYDYVYLALLLMLLTVCWLLNLETNDKKQNHSSWRSWVALGALLGVAISIKQTQAFWTIFSFSSILLVYNWGLWRDLSRKATLVAIGIATVWVPLTVWLLVEGVTPDMFLRQVLVRSGPKGGLDQIFFSWTSGILRYGESEGIRAAIASLIAISRQVAPWMLSAMILREWASRYPSSQTSKNLASSFVILMGVLAWRYRNDSLGVFGQLLQILGEQFVANVYVGSWVALSIFVIWLVYTKNSVTQCRSSVALLVVVLSVVWACGMSAGLTENGVFLAGGLALSAYVFVAREHAIASLLVGLTALAVVAGSWWAKDETPYAWWTYQTAGENQASVQFDSGLQRGLRTTEELKESYQQTNRLLVAAKECPGEVVVYPHMPLFLLDADLTPGGRLSQYWYDFASSAQVQLETQRLSTSAISALVFMDLPDIVKASHESLFGEGRPLEQRQLEALLLAKSEKLQQVMSESVSESVELKVWASPCAISVATSFYSGED